MIAIDLGSNSCRILAYDCHTHQKLNAYEALVKTADGLYATKRINDGALQRIIDALHSANAIMDFTSHDVKAVTTEAMRQAHNRDEIIAAIDHATGVRFEVIDAQTEAELTLLAVNHRLKTMGLKANNFVLVDIGGGSTEVTFCKADKHFSKSFGIGIVTLAQQCESLEVVQKSLNHLLDPVREYVNAIYETQEKPDFLVSTAGTPTTLAGYLEGMNYHTYDASKINGYKLSREGVAKGLKDLMAMDEAQRALYVGVGRESLIAAGIVIMQTFYELLGFESSIVIDDSLREGVALDYCNNRSKERL